MIATLAMGAVCVSNLSYSYFVLKIASSVCNCQIDANYLLVGPLVDDKFHHNIVKVDR